jgi:hypothetical protein
MLDDAGIMFSSVMILFVIVRAVRLDSVQPWFQAMTGRDDAGKTARRPWQRRG